MVVATATMVVVVVVVVVVAEVRTPTHGMTIQKTCTLY